MKPTATAAALTAVFLLTAAAPIDAPVWAAGPTRTAVFAGGCFWSIEYAMEKQPGVLKAVSGYAGGDRPNPTYRSHQGHLEAVEVAYDPRKTSYARLVHAFFRNIDPTDAGGQICDRGHSYTTAIFVTTEAERQAAVAAKAEVERVLGKPVATRILRGSPFWPAEAYHQDFARKNPAQYERYRKGCGRDRALKAVWGAAYRS
ncbi:MAG: peptide-methionine (S)-S-oxide reductase MsrA [Phenylobacterium sp.]|uniref:peptide-methionine (S)-S-oxide reductase MsrA n=1 Tax=Phenylobacterium sp. TaxID=1871053 RepID=UPI00391D42EE